MLKKLLASVLALATVASCAFIPTALTSADTTYETATELAYNIWKLDNPDAADEAAVKVNVYVIGQTSQNLTNVIGADVKPSEMDQEKAEKLAWDENTGLEDDTTALTYHTVNATKTAAENVWIATVVEYNVVVYSDWNTSASAPASTKAEDLEAADVTVLETYTYPVDNSAVLADMYATQIRARLANKEFSHWSYKAADHLVVPQYQEILNQDATYYTDFSVLTAKNNKVTAAELVSGAYYAINNGENVAESYKYSVKLPNNDKPNWDEYMANFQKSVYDRTIKDTKGDSYVPNKFIQVSADKWVMTYTKKADDSTTSVTMSYKLSLVYNGATVMSWENTSYKVAKAEFTTEPEAVYAIASANDSNAKDTLAEALVAGKADGSTIYALTGEVRYELVNRVNNRVELMLYVEPATQYTVYSFAEGDAVVKDTVYLTASQVKTTNYANIDGEGELTKENEVIVATQEELEVSPTATIDGVPAVYAYAKVSGTTIECTYKLGDATIDGSEFETTTGKFDAQAYFCRDAKAGDKVVVKVSLTDAGVAKNVDWTKVEVKYATEGDVVVGDQYWYEANGEYKAGVATDLYLAEGTNIVVGGVYYDGKLVCTFAPFYALV